MLKRGTKTYSSSGSVV